MARATQPIPDDPGKAADAAYAHGLRLLSGRELAEAAVRSRLAERGFDEAAINSAIARLTRAGALSDQRAVRAVARTLVQVKRRGRYRAQRELEAKGFRKEDAAVALAELLSDDDEHALIERTLDARLRGRPVSRHDVAGMKRVYAALVRRGFPPSAVGDAVRRRFAHAPLDEDDPDQ